MSVRNKAFAIISAVFGICFLILQPTLAATGIREGITLVLRSVIPSLFPFLILSHILNSMLFGASIPVLRPICKACGIPSGAEGLFLIGLIGGYPVGAQSIYSVYKSGGIDCQTAHRLLGFCNNAGPAFIFGMLAPIFTRTGIPWLLWLIQIISAILVGILLPGKQVTTYHVIHRKGIPLRGALEHSVKTMAMISGWVILFKMLLLIFQTCFPHIPTPLQILFAGLLELSNGCCVLSTIPSQGARMLLAALFLNFGGFCVTMQTYSVVQDLGAGKYLSGKLAQTIIACSAAWIIQTIIYSGTDRLPLWPLCTALALSVLIAAFRLAWKKVVAFRKNLLYNS